MSNLTLKEKMDMSNLRFAIREGKVPLERREEVTDRYLELLRKSMNSDKPTGGSK